jgi:two-component system, cell cycle response regulator
LQRRSDSIIFWDPLTHLWNRHVFEFRLSEELFRMRRYKSRPLSIVTVDVVGMNAINDVYGRDAGNLYLRGVACLLETAAGDADMTARIGGDEFALLLSETDTRGAVQIAARIRRLAGTADARWGFLPVAIKVGTATTLDGNTTGRALLSCAQVARGCNDSVDL